MDGLILTAVVVIGSALLVLPIIALVLAVGARRRNLALQQRLVALEWQVHYQRQHLFAVDARQQGPEAQAASPAPPAVAPQPAVEQQQGPPAPQPPPAPAPHPSTEPPRSIEEHIGLVWFTRVGAVIGIMAAGWFFKYMVDNDWVGPWGRVGLGYLAGVVLLAWGELMAWRRRSHAIFVQGILGLGLALLLMSTYAAASFYQLVPVLLSFGVVAVLAALGGALALRHRAEAILVLSLLAALLNPAVLSTGHDRPLALFCYLLVMTTAALAACVRAGFRATPFLAITGVLVLFGGWYMRFFDASPPLPPGVVDRAPAATQGAYYPLPSRWIPLLFALVFPLQWAGAAIAARRAGLLKTRTVLFMAAALASHAAYTALLWDHPLVLGGVLCGLALLLALLLLREDLGGWLGLPMLAAGAAYAGITQTANAGSYDGLLAVAGGCFLIYLGAMVVDLLIRRAPWSVARLAVLTGAGLVYGALFITATAPDQGLARALLALGTGLVYLVAGALMSRRAQPGDVDRALAPLGLALSFFTLAVALLLSGPSVTVVWTVEGAMLAFLATRMQRQGRPGHPAWLVASLLMFTLAMSRLLLLDLTMIETQRQLFLSSQGARGTLLPTALLHPRAWALAAMGAGLLLSALLSSRVRQRTLFVVTSVIMAVGGHLALLGLLVGEARLLLTSAPGALPAGLAAEAFRARTDALLETLAQQDTRLQMITTVVLGLYAILLLAAGFVFRDRNHRLYGISLFGLTLLKLGLWDIWSLETVHKIAVGGAIAALLLAGGFLYGRFSSRIRTLLTRDEGKAATLLLVLAGATLLGAPAAQALERHRYSGQRLISGVQAAGDYSLVVDPALYSAAATGATLADLRVVGPDGQEVPFVRRHVVARPRQTTRPARLLDPVRLSDGSARAVLDLGPQPDEHSSVRLSITGRVFLRRVLVESSSDGQRFGQLASGAYVFRFGSAAGQTAWERTEIRYPETNTRYLRVTLLPGEQESPLTITAAARVNRSSGDQAGEYARVPLRLTTAATRRGDGTSVHSLSPLPANLPLARLTLALPPGGPGFVRRVKVEASTRRQAWVPVGSGVIYRVLVQGRDVRPLFVDLNAQLSADPGAHRHLRLLVADGDDRPLQLTGAAAIYRQEELVFRATRAGPHTLLVGRRGDRAPRYDLAELMRRGDIQQVRPCRLGSLQPNPRFRQPTATVKPRPWTERHQRLLQVIIGAVVLSLAVWTVVLMRRSGRRKQ